MYFRDNNGKIIVEGYDRTSAPSSLTGGQRTAIIIFALISILLAIGFILYRRRANTYY